MSSERPSGSASLDTLRTLAAQAGAVIVFPPTMGWDVALVQRPHHLARALARAGLPVVFELEPDRASAALEQVEPRLFLARGAAPDLERLPNRIVWAFAYNVPPDRALEGVRPGGRS